MARGHELVGQVLGSGVAGLQYPERDRNPNVAQQAAKQQQPKEMTCADFLLEESNHVVQQAEAVFAQALSVLERLLLPAAPAPDPGNDPASQLRPYPPLMDQMRSDLFSISSSLAKIGDLLSRVSA